MLDLRGKEQRPPEQDEYEVEEDDGATSREEMSAEETKWMKFMSDCCLMAVVLTSRNRLHDIEIS